MENLEYRIAKGLLDIEAVRLSPEKPFLWASGLHSPIYCDNRKALSYPDFRKTICEAMIEVINAEFKDVDVIAGVATVLRGGERVVVIEDLISTGQSSLAAVDALLKCGVHIAGMVAIFSYNFDRSRRAFENADVELHTLSNYDTLVDVALDTGYIKEGDVKMLKEWRYDPDKWSKDHE